MGGKWKRVEERNGAWEVERKSGEGCWKEEEEGSGEESGGWWCKEEEDGSAKGWRKEVAHGKWKEKVEEGGARKRRREMGKKVEDGNRGRKWKRVEERSGGWEVGKKVK
ncbi:hypothetical protein Pcinc_026778 [Petrolisthes cinctipes]|uniref:Uncharacterized protein n=1 Tax=Petrolisthes cinctipes TaxID=88211 RepID=A0AAE1K9K5_PETCI|nr:hypothetical protein Pcinc_026778 [Petrolisthes cinctipes]